MNVGREEASLAESVLDMTGDGRAERLRLHASGSLADSLELTFTISSDSRVLYEDVFVVDRVVGFDASPRPASAEEWDGLLDYYRGSFELGRFTTVQDFTRRRRLDPDVRPRGVDIDAAQWRVLLTSDVPVFSYSPGGDRSYSLAWSEAAGSFLDMYPCC